VEISILDHAEPAQSERICQLLLASYAVEAGLIGVEDFVPLRRRSVDIRRAASTFYGCVDDGHLVAVAEVEREANESLNIAGFAIHPRAFRRRVGSRLLRHVLSTTESTRFTVSTASANAPAIGLYEKHGFRLRGRWVTYDGIHMVTLEVQGVEVAPV